ncbi:hypothetical protein MIDIC_20049 [Alphaproteobacteria bacterium]
MSDFPHSSEVVPLDAQTVMDTMNKDCTVKAEVMLAFCPFCPYPPDVIEKIKKTTEAMTALAGVKVSDINQLAAQLSNIAKAVNIIQPSAILSDGQISADIVGNVADAQKLAVAIKALSNISIRDVDGLVKQLTTLANIIINTTKQDIIQDSNKIVQEMKGYVQDSKDLADAKTAFSSVKITNVVELAKKLPDLANAVNQIESGTISNDVHIKQKVEEYTKDSADLVNAKKDLGSIKITNVDALLNQLLTLVGVVNGIKQGTILNDAQIKQEIETHTENSKKFIAAQNGLSGVKITSVDELAKQLLDLVSVVNGIKQNTVQNDAQIKQKIGEYAKDSVDLNAAKKDLSNVKITNADELAKQLSNLASTANKIKRDVILNGAQIEQEIEMRTENSKKFTNAKDDLSGVKITNVEELAKKLPDLANAVNQIQKNTVLNDAQIVQDINGALAGSLRWSRIKVIVNSMESVDKLLHQEHPSFFCTFISWSVVDMSKPGKDCPDGAVSMIAFDSAVHARLCAYCGKCPGVFHDGIKMPSKSMAEEICSQCKKVCTAWGGHDSLNPDFAFGGEMSTWHYNSATHECYTT